MRLSRSVLLAVLAVFGLALVTQALPAWRTRSLPTGEAQWIWKKTDRRDYQPTAFYAVRDFELKSPPARARLLVTADEEYVLTLNGKPVGAGAYRRGAPLDVYEVGPLLLEGGNRLVAELRSDRGTGGFLVSLQDEDDGRPLVVSDEEWRIFPRHELGLVRGWLPAGDGEPAFSWGYPPIGRWGTPEPGRPSPLLFAKKPPLIPAVSALPVPAGLGPEEVRRPSSPVLYDWGRELEGRLTLALPPSKDLGVGLLFVGNRPPDPLRDEPADAVLIMAGRHDWLDSRARRFRYALLVGIARPVSAAVRPEALTPSRPAEDDGRVFGVEGPPLRTPVEDEVWSELQRVPGVARRKDL
ncbi:MAG TPA: hypothetical protein VF789_09400 [Thermoanaerobaculia bacterium]